MGKLKTTGHWNYEPRTYAMRMSVDLRLELADAALERSLRQGENKKLSRAYWKQRLAIAMADLKHLDPTGWEAWFDSPAVPERGTEKSRALIIEARIRELAKKPVKPLKPKLYRDAFIWETGNKNFLVFDSDCKKVHEFSSEAQAKSHIDKTLDTKN